MANGQGSTREVKAGRAFVEITAKDSAFRQSLEKAKEAMVGFGSSLMKIGGLASGALTGGIAAFSNFGEEVGKAAAQTGTSVEWMSKMAHAAKMCGLELDDVLDGIVNLQTSDLLQNYKNPEAQFEAAMNMINAAKTQGEKAKLVNEMLSESGMRLIPLIDKYKEFGVEAEKVGAVLSGEDVKAAQEAMKAFNKLKEQLSLMSVKIGKALLPYLLELKDAVISVAVAVGNFVDRNKDIIVMVAKASLAFTAAGAAIFALGHAVGFASTALGALGVILGAIASPAGLAVAAIGGVVAALIKVGGEFETIDKYSGEVWANITSDFGGAWDAIKSALMNGNISDAAAIAMKGVNLAFAEATAGIKETWLGLTNIVNTSFDDMLTGIVVGIKKAFGAIEKKLNDFKRIFKMLGQATKYIFGGSTDAENDAAMKSFDEERSKANAAIDRETQDFASAAAIYGEAERKRRDARTLYDLEQLRGELGKMREDFKNEVTEVTRRNSKAFTPAENRTQEKGKNSEKVSSALTAATGSFYARRFTESNSPQSKIVKTTESIKRILDNIEAHTLKLGTWR